jgi:hypothetical protein
MLLCAAKKRTVIKISPAIKIRPAIKNKLHCSAAMEPCVPSHGPEMAGRGCGLA